MSTQQTAPTNCLTADGVKYAYRIIGERSNDSLPLLLLNHIRSNIDLWDPDLVNGFAETGRQVITYDYTGHGHSEGEVPTSVKGMAAGVASFLKELLPKLSLQHIDVLGFSVGGYVAQQLTLDNPTLVNSLILAGTGPSLGPDLERPQAEVQSACFTDPPNPAAVAPAFFPAVVADQGQAWLNRIFTARAEVAGKNGEPEFVSFMGLPKLANLVQAYLGWDADPVPYAMLQTIQKNVLVTAGQNDLIVSTKNSWVLAHQLPRAHFIQYACSGHGHLFQYAKLYVQHCNEFLDGKWPQVVSAGPSLADQAAETGWDDVVKGLELAEAEAL